MPKKGTYSALGAARMSSGEFAASAQLSEYARIKIEQRQQDAASQSASRKELGDLLKKAKTSAVLDYSKLKPSTWNIGKKIYDKHMEEMLAVKDAFMANPTPDLEFRINELENQFKSDVSKLVMIGNDMTKYTEGKKNGEYSKRQNLGIDNAIGNFSNSIPEFSKSFDGSTEMLDGLVSAYTDNVRTADAVGAINLKSELDGLTKTSLSQKTFEGNGRNDRVVNEDGSTSISMYREYDRKSAKAKFDGLQPDVMRELQLDILMQASTDPELAEYLDEDDNGEAFVSRENAFDFYEEFYLKPGTRAGEKRVAVSSQANKAEKDKETNMRTYTRVSEMFSGKGDVAHFGGDRVTIDGFISDVDAMARVYDPKTKTMAVKVEYSYKERGEKKTRNKLYSDSMAGRQSFSNDFAKGFDYDEFVNKNIEDVGLTKPTVDEITNGISSYISGVSENLSSNMVDEYGDAIISEEGFIKKMEELLPETLNRTSAGVVLEYIDEVGVGDWIGVKGITDRFDPEDAGSREELFEVIGAMTSIAESMQGEPAEAISGAIKTYIKDGKTGISKLSDYISSLETDEAKNNAKLDSNRMLKEGKTEEDVLTAISKVSEDTSDAEFNSFLNDNFASDKIDAARDLIRTKAAAMNMTIPEFMKYYNERKR